MAAARQFLTTAIADNRTQMAAISDVAERTEAGVDPKLLIESLMGELAKAATRATKLEVSLSRNHASWLRSGIPDQVRGTGQDRYADRSAEPPGAGGVFPQGPARRDGAGRAVSALLIDIDHFKRFNDEFGHGVGDQVLRLMAKVLRERVRDIDLPARYGGEELIAVLPSAGLATVPRSPNASGVRLRNATSPAAPPAKRCPASRFRSGWRSSRAANPWPI